MTLLLGMPVIMDIWWLLSIWFRKVLISELIMTKLSVRYASYNGHLDVVKYLVSQGADIRADNDEAVRWASFNGHLEVVKYLVSQGALDPRN